MRTAMTFSPDGRRNAADLHDSSSFDHVGRDAGADFAAGRVLADLADADPRIVVGCADLTYVTRLSTFGARHPRRFLYYGISERNMIGAAAGLATTGHIPYVCTFACFSAILAYENIRTDLAYPQVPVRILATHAGISMGFFGTSHHATEDIAALRAVAGLTVLSPCDPVATEAMLRATVGHDGPIYFRIGRGREKAVYTDPTQLRLDRPTTLTQGGDVLLLATGVMVQEALAAAATLATDGIGATVVDVHTLKPFPRTVIAELAAAHSSVVTVEEHTIEGGLGTLTVEALAAAGVGTPVHKHGLRDEFAIIGPPTHLYQYYGLDPHGIATVVRRMHEHRARTPLVSEPLWTPDDRAAVLAARS
ncbi:transketolase family protein [Paractinoplanes lichenicola]|uniref:Transketolase family protein n=1 Tax=Paractinoplanes lichenicola TaxID=2802976 RepID=A0ABS1VF31_9ACTN|nr:transketolase C-terminal domain-containing protein [Actinoplanes lichenicola]MBL7253243.1 transketolase family protein [Actinoplanes lichenicola]